MIPAAFDYFRPRTLEEAISLLGRHGEDAKVLAGGHSLIPAMKLRLAQPRTIIDLGRITGLNYIRETDGRIAIGAMATHYDIESSTLLADRCPLLTELAPHIGDVQVRNRGTLGGSLVTPIRRPTGRPRCSRTRPSWTSSGPMATARSKLRISLST